MDKKRFAAIVALLSIVVALCAAVTGLLAAKGLCHKKPHHFEDEQVVFRFDTDGGEELPPSYVDDWFRWEYLYRPYKPDFWFIGWQYEGAFVEDMELSDFKAGEYTLKAVWQKADSADLYAVGENFQSALTGGTRVYCDTARDGYRLTVDAYSADYAKWYNAGAAALDAINAFKAAHPEQDLKVSEFSINFYSGDEYRFYASFINTKGESAQKLSDLRDNWYGAVSLLTEDEYRQAASGAV